MLLIIGNLVALAASILMVYSGVIKNKKRIIYIQSIQIGLFVISNIILNGISGAIINAIGFVRNILSYKDKLKVKEKIIITVLSVILILCFNNLGFIGLLPLISTVVYLWFMTIKDVSKFKLLVIFTMVLWTLYDFTIKSYTSGIFNILTIVTNVIALIRLNLSKKRLTKEVN